ncbi:LysM peptidoglycan-binding domain-containing protein [Mesobacillus zeae]|uniref:LysM peptidoglycan-binding domain-containing protein n=1 Tax=Mesobacillus zeae TaxID=1917180 RepID=A0A398BHI7_9BACI|nr:LysM peptidoglycan-binding domain-containing protein [Mesobacillus zeae]RID88098.1 LysM peptidoglycan-binding domain-containing protein [Mesobacillus zeae]
MKKIWETYTYAIILLAVSMFFFIVFAAQAGQKDEYITVTVKQGETLWAIAQEYSEGQSLTTTEFIKVIERKNGIAGGIIRTGDKLVVPVAADRYKGQVASSE